MLKIIHIVVYIKNLLYSIEIIMISELTVIIKYFLI
jgi:hypothetical protein